MDNKKIITAVASAVAIVWIFCISFMVSMKVAHDKRDSAVASVPSTAVQTTTASTTTKPTTTKPVSTMPRYDGIGNNADPLPEDVTPQWKLDEESSKAAEASKKAEEEAKKQTTTEPSIVPKDKQAILDAYTTGVNRLKAEQNFTLGKNDTLEIVIDEITGGIEGLAQNMISGNEPVPGSYTFTGGTDAATGMTPTQVIAPLNLTAAVNPEGVKNATVKANSDGGYTVKIELNDELQTLSEAAPNHVTMVEVVNKDALTMAGMTITKLDITYSGAYVEATFNKDNKIVSMYHYLPVSRCEGSGRLTLIPGDVLIHGLYTSTYTVSY